MRVRPVTIAVGALAIWLIAIGLGKLSATRARTSAEEEALRSAAAAETPAALATRAEALKDPVLHDAAVLAWVEGNRGQRPEQDGQAACALVAEGVRDLCWRRWHAVHLRR